jgi:hypothetical protein
LITDIDVQENPKLELKELEGSIMDGKTVAINAAGIIPNGLRGARDGYSYFGYTKTKNNIIINDYILNMQNPLGVANPIAFKVYFDKPSKNYFLAPGSDSKDGESIVFIKLEKKFV